MIKVLELSAPVFDSLQSVAAANGTTPEEWIRTQLSLTMNGSELTPEKTLAERMKGLVGLFNSASEKPLSENCGKRFADYLEKKRREGRL